jgi:RNA polymerase sigma-70 factor (sigma-E family)
MWARRKVSVDRMSDADADFTAFVQVSGSRSLRLAVLLAGDLGAGQDLLQSVHEQLYKRWRRHGSPAAPEPYVRKALVNAASKTRLRRTRLRETLVSQAPDEGSYEMGTDVLLRGHLLPALKRLPARQRSVVVLRYFADLTETETADQLGCTVGTVKTLASRALRRLREDPILAAALSTTEA